MPPTTTDVTDADEEQDPRFSEDGGQGPRFSEDEDQGPRLTEPAAFRYLADRARRVRATEMLAAGPRAARFLARSATRNLRFPEQRTHPEIPTRVPSWGTAFGVWLDELFLAYMATTRLHPGPEELDRISDEVDRALVALHRAGALDDPSILHPAPRQAPDVELESASYRGIRFARATFDSGYAPPVDLPGLTRWRTAVANTTAHTMVMRHRTPRPWIVQLHGFGMGNDSDLVAMRALHFHRDLGLNVAQPVLPLHGPRAGGPDDVEPLTLDYVANVHTVTQAVADVRRLIAWIRAVEPGQPIAVHGVSMGGYVAAMLAGLEPGLDCVISGVPTVDLAWVMERHTPEDDRVRMDERGLFGHRAEQIHSVVSPLSFEPLLPLECRFVYAGVADRMATPGQAHRLWEHWDQPPVLWYRGAHVAFAWSRDVRAFVDRALRRSGLVNGAMR